MHASVGKFVDFVFSDQLFPDKKNVAPFLYDLLYMGPFHIVTVAFNLSPSAFNIKRVIERKLFMDHSNRVVCPIVIPTMLGQMRLT